jgi:tripartite ATP-independent transporter DctP family solute receptor
VIINLPKWKTHGNTLLTLGVKNLFGCDWDDVRLISGTHANLATFKGLVEGGSGGNVVVKVFPASQLGNERELIEGTKIGTIQMCFVSGAIAGFYKEAQVLDIPYLFASGPVAWKVMDGPFGKDMAADILKQTGMRVLAYGETGFRNFTNSKLPIKSPADMKGLKIRVMETPVYVNMVKALGAAPTPIAWSEVYTALQQKVVDGQENPVATIVQAKLYEVQKYMILDGHSYGCDFFLINEKFYQSLPKESQELIKTSYGKGIFSGKIEGMLRELPQSPSDAHRGVKTLLLRTALGGKERSHQGHGQDRRTRC